MRSDFHKPIPTRFLIYLLSGKERKRTRSVYRWKKENYICPVEIVEGKGPGNSDLWDIAGATWTAILDELFENGLTTDTQVYLMWKMKANQEITDLRGSQHIQRLLVEHNFDVVVQLLRGLTKEQKRFSELHLTKSTEYRERVKAACGYGTPMVAANGEEVRSVVSIFAKQTRARILKQYETTLYKELTAQVKGA
jgi:hypothetical protein